MNYAGEIILASVRGVKGVLKTQLTLALITFIMLCIGFAIIDISQWGLKAFLITIVDLIPLVGSGLIMLPWAFILLIIGNTDLAVKLLIIYVILFITRQIVEPILSGKNIGVRPIYTFASTVICSILFGPWGLLLGPVFAIVIRTILDIRSRINTKN